MRAMDMDANFSDWFSRPVRIQKFTWAENATFGQTFNPWVDYFSSPEIYAKLKGFSRLRCKLKIKLIINASPFQYSLGMMSYRPLCGTSDSNAFSGGAFNISTTNTTNAYMVHSQYPHVMFKPQLSEGCEMELPFLYFKDWIDTSDSNILSNELRDMGRMTLQSFVPLYTASSSAAANPITISVYAWAEDIALSGPTMGLQSDEYSDRPVSTVASAIAKSAGALSGVPYIGPYARATQMVAGALGSAAHWFGFSNPPVIDAVRNVRISYASNMASPEISTQIEKISMDPKNELNVDSRTVGLDGTDEMAFSHIMSGDTWFNSCTWRATDTPDAYLFSTHVTPFMYNNESYVTTTYSANAMQVHMVPATMLGQMFDYWTGPVKFKFIVAASKFHRGRVRLTYDPQGPWTAGQLGTARLHQHVWDISECDTFEFEVPFMASTTFLQCDPTPSTGSSTAKPSSAAEFPAMAYNSKFFNGTLQLSVMNELTASVGSDVTIQCFVSSPKVQFASPKDISSTSSFMLVSPQSDDVDGGVESVQISAIPTSDKVFSTYMGESVVSIRSLLHRAVYWDSIRPNLIGSIKLPSFSGYSSTYRSLVNKWCIPRLPLPTYNVPLDAVANTQRLQNNLYPWTSYAGGVSGYTGYGSAAHTTYITLMSSCYAGWRGSIVWRGVYSQYDDKSFVRVRSVEVSPLRTNWTTFRPTTTVGGSAPSNSPYNCMSGGHVTAFNDYATPATVDAYTYSMAVLAKGFTPTLSNGSGGLVRCTVDKTPIVEAVLPHYSPYRMLPSNNIRYQSSLCGDTLVAGQPVQASDTFGIEMVLDNPNRDANTTTLPNIDLYCAAGPDFTCFKFLAVPTLYRYTSFPAGHVPQLAPVNND